MRVHCSVLAVAALSLAQASHGDADLRFNYCRTRCVTRARCPEVGPLPLRQGQGENEFGVAWQTVHPCTNESDVEDGVWWDGVYLKTVSVPSSFEHVAAHEMNGAAMRFCHARCREDLSCFFWTLKKWQGGFVCLRQSTRGERHLDPERDHISGCVGPRQLGGPGESSFPDGWDEGSRATPPFYRALAGWTCLEECTYACMRAHHIERVKVGAEVLQYWGKWPFCRVLFVQEFFSSFFSALNIVPHYVFLVNVFLPMVRCRGGLLSVLANVPWSSGASGTRSSQGQSHLDLVWVMLAAHAVTHTNLWWWSTVFHARDLHTFEVLDYLCAHLGGATSVVMVYVVVLKIGSWKGLLLVVGPYSVILGSFLGSFLFGGSLAGSYGVNMAIGAGTVGSAGLCGLGWTFAIRTRPYVWKLQLFVFCMICAASLEVIFDFPPFFDLMDAHAIWHGLTPLLFHLLYSVWKDHMAFEEAIVSKQTAQNAESRDRYL